MAFTITGGDQIARMLEELGVEALSLTREELGVALDEVMEEVKELVPVDSGLTKETITKRISTRKGNVSGQVGVRRITGKQRIKLRERYAKKGTTGQLYDAFYSIFTNYGTKFQRPQRWMNRAFRRVAQPAVEKFAARLFARLETKTKGAQ